MLDLLPPHTRVSESYDLQQKEEIKDKTPSMTPGWVTYSKTVDKNEVDLILLYEYAMIMRLCAASS